MSKVVLYNSRGDRRTISSIDYTPAVKSQGWYAEGDRPIEPTVEEIEEFHRVHPALELLNMAQTAAQLTALPSIGKARAEEILALRTAPWESLEAAMVDLAEISIDWDAIEQWGEA